ncbi:MAG: ATP-dependent helicase C-terminal domain-containing protein, partial [Lysobacterales bacterium]
GEAARDDRIESRWRQLAAFRQDRRTGLDGRRDVLAQLQQQAGNWHRRLGGGPVPAQIDSHQLGNLLLAAWPDRIARRQSGDRYALSNGRGARLAPDSALRGEPWLVVAGLRYDPRDSLIQLAAPFDPEQLQGRFPERFSTVEQGRFDPATQSVAVFREHRFMALVLERERLAQVDPEQRLAGLLDGVRQLGLAALPWTPALEQWLARVRCLAHWCPELALPDFSNEALLEELEQWLAPFLAGKPKLSALTAGDLANAVQARLDHGQQQALERLAPASLAVPSGRRLRLHYEPGQAPVLPVKLQEMFGCANTPTVAGGKVPVLLHLLSPAQRPIQVTADLAGFWQRTYPEVKKELKGRYPRHPWPDDPWSASPDHRTKAAQARAKARSDN